MGRKPNYALRKIYVLREVEIDPREIRKGDVFRFDPLNKKDTYANKDEWFYSEAKPKQPEGLKGFDMSDNLEFKSRVLIHPKLGRTLNFKDITGGGK